MVSTARDISFTTNGQSREVSTSLGQSTSPTATFHSPPSSYGGVQFSRTTTGGFAKQLKPFATRDIKILLLENVNQTGRDILAKQGYQVEFVKSSLGEDELIQKIRWGITFAQLSYEALLSNVMVQGCPCNRRSLQNQTHGAGLTGGQEPHSYRLFLHRNQSGRPDLCSPAWDCRLQLPL